MIRLLAPVAPLLLGVAILLIGQGLQGALLPFRATLEGFSTQSIGLMGGAYFFGFTIGCLRGSTLVHQVGHVRVFAAMTAAASAIPLFHGLWAEDWSWWILRSLTGFCFAVLYIAIESWINERSTNETRGAVFSAYTLITLTMSAAGQQMLQLYDVKEMALFAIASALVSIAAIPVVLSTSKSPAQAESRKPLDLPKIFRVSPAGALGCLVSGLAAGTYWSLAPVFVSGFSPEASVTAWFMTAVMLGGALGQWPLGRWSDQTDRRWVIATSALIASVSGAAFWLLSSTMDIQIMMLLGVIWGMFSFPIYSVSAAHTNDHAEPSEFVMISSGLLLLYGIGAVAGPFAAPVFMKFTGAGGMFLFTSVSHLPLFAYILIRITFHKPAPEEEHSTFTDSLAATQTASLVYEEELVEQESELLQ